MARKEILSSRERVQLALDHRETDRIPIAMVCAEINAPAYRALAVCLQRTRGLSVEEYLSPLLDIRTVAPAYIGPVLAENEDIWGVRRVPVSYGSGSYDEIEYSPLAGARDLDDLAHYCWPRTEWFDYSVLPDRIAAVQADGEYCVMVTNGNLFESAWYMRGFEQIFLDMVLDPDFVHELMSRVANFYVEHFTRLLEAAQGGVDLVFTADDIAGQQGLLMSLDMWSEFLKPYHRRLNQTIHQFGAHVIYHTDGAVMDAVDGLHDTGIDILQALQFSAAGMDPATLKRRHGHHLAFQGGVSVQTTLPFGSVDDVRQEVQGLISILGKDGGYILGPSHSIQAGTPPENILALFDTARDYYPF